MNDNEAGGVFGGFVTIVIVGLILGVFAVNCGQDAVREYWKREAIKQGHAEWATNPATQDPEFKWLPPCKK